MERGQHQAETALREREAIYRLLVEGSNDPIVLVDSGGRVVHASPSFVRLFGESQVFPLERVHPDDREAVRRALLESTPSEGRVTVFRPAHAAGAIRWLECTGCSVRHRDQPHVLAVLRDVTARKHADDARRAQLRFLECLEHVSCAIHSADDVDSMLSAVLSAVLEDFGCDRAWLLRPANAEATSLHVVMERTRPEWPGAPADAVDFSIEREVAAAPFRDVLVHDGAVRFGSEHDLPRLPGVHLGVRSAMVLAIRPQLQGPYLLGLQQCSHDRAWTEEDARLFEQIGVRLASALRTLLTLRQLRESEGKQRCAEQASHVAQGELDRLRASEREFRAHFELAGVGQAQADPATGRLLRVNRKLCELLGYTERELLAGDFAELTHPADRERELSLFYQLVKGEIPELVIEKRMIRKDGAEIWFRITASLIYDDEGRALRSVAIGEDVTLRKRAEQALLESHALLNAVIDGTSDAIFVKDLEGRYRLINSAGARLLGRSVEDVLGRDDHALFSPETASLIMAHDRRVLASGTSLTSEEIGTAAGATRTYLSNKSAQRDEHGQIVGLIGIARDITELKHLEEQFRQAQKMEAIGRLAGGVAHDFNNLLTVINGNAVLIGDHLRGDPDAAELVAEIQEAGKRAANLTSQLLAFSRKQVLQPEVVNLNVLLDALWKMLRRLIGEHIELTFDGAPDLGWARVDPGQFEQAVINLAVNARDAMPKGGRLTIETRNVHLDEGYAAQHTDVNPARYVCVAVTDSGAGMDAETRARIFEPFFTTKDRDKGTGLGLPMVYGFLKQSGGHVEVDTEKGVGTTIRLYLPRAEGATAVPRPTRESARALGGMETVLLVEDESSVRNLVARVLRSRGYRVIEATTGQQALALADKHAGPIHLLLTDLVMPRMNGRELALALTKMRGVLRVLFMSGYTDDTVTDQIEDGDVGFLQKPFTPAVLAAKVREVLDADGAASSS